MFKREKTANLPGAGKKEGLRVTIDRRVKLEFHGSKVTLLSPEKTGDGLEKGLKQRLENLRSRKKITKKAHAGRGNKIIWEMSEENSQDQA